jgi:hypothetical protein
VGRPALSVERLRGDTPPMGEAAVLDQLARADSAFRLPRLGGMARPNGVVVVSERFWAFAGTDGTVREGSMPAPASRSRRLPLLRGLARLAASVTPLFRGGGVARKRERVFLLVAMLLPFGLVFAPPVVGNVGGVAITLVLLAWLFRGRTLFLHGAEHRAIAATEFRSLVSTWNGEAKPSRISKRCGTNFAALALPVTLLFDRLFPVDIAFVTPVVVAALSLGLTMELWQAVQASSRRSASVFLAPGLALQRVTTREPSLDETRVALTAVASVLRRELA